MYRGTNLEDVQVYNRCIVFDHVRRYAPLSRADIARRTGLTKPTISNIVGDLLGNDLLREAGKVQGQLGGKPSTHLELNNGGAYALGLNLNRDSLVALLVNLAGEVLDEYHAEITQLSPEQALEQLADAAELLMGRNEGSRARTLGVGVGVPGPIDETTYRVGSSNFSTWQDVPLATELQKRLGLSVLLENNATAAAIGEQWYGAGKQLQTFFYVFFGVGLGGGVVTHNQPYRGAHGKAGGFGKTLVTIGVEQKRLEDVVSLTVLYRELARHGIYAQKPQDLEGLFEQGEPALLNWLAEASEQLAVPLANVESALDPAAIIFGGRLPRALLTHVVTQLEPRLAALRTPDDPTSLKLLVGATGQDAAALGVATLPIYHTMSPHQAAPATRMEVPMLPYS